MKFWRNHEFRVRVEDRPETVINMTPPATHEEKMERYAMYGAAINNAMWQGTKLVTAYMVLDTVRKIAVRRLS